METAIYQLEFLDGRIFKIYCANKTQKTKVIQTANKLKNKIKLMSEIQSGIHTQKQFEEIIKAIHK